MTTNTGQGPDEAPGSGPPGGKPPEGDDLFSLLDPLDDVLRRAAATEPPPPPRDLSEGRWRAFHDLGLLLTRSRIDVDEVLRAVLDLAIEQTGAERGLLLARREARFGDVAHGPELSPGITVEVEIAHAAGGVVLSPEEIGYSRTVVRRALDERRPLRLADVAVPGASEGGSTDSARLLGIRAAMCAPLAVLPPAPVRPASLAAPTPMPGPGRSGEATERRRVSYQDIPDLLGAIYVDRSSQERPFSDDDLAFFEALAHQATTTILAARLYEQATTDPLSRLLARSQLAPRLARLADRATQIARPWSALLVDCDKFKRINDEIGHGAGDQVIRELGAAIIASLRTSDIAFRYGGEEFLLALPETDAAGAQVVAERLRASIAGRRFTAHQIAVTVSIGVATASRELGPVSWEELARRADMALLEAKSAGRDRVVPWSEALEEKTPPAQRPEPRAPVERDPTLASDLLAALAAPGEASDAKELLALALDRTIRATRAERGAIALMEGGKLVTAAALNSIGRPLESDAPFAREAAERSIAERKALLVQLASGASALAIPLVAKADALGAIVVEGRSLSSARIEPNLPLYSSLGRQVALAIENSRLRARAALGLGSGGSTS